MLGTLEFDPPVIDAAQLPARARAVLALLAAQAGHPVSRARIAEIVWARSAPDQARQSLRQSLTILRTACASQSAIAIVADAASATLKLTGITTDVAALEAMAENPAEASSRDVRNLYRGVFLAEFPAISEPFEEWLSSERSRIGTLACDILGRLGARQLELGQADQAIQTARDFLRLDSMREDAHRLAMQAYAAAGRSSEALQHYEECVRLLKAELGVAPDAATQALMRSIRASIPASQSGISRASAAAPAPQPVLQQAPPLAEQAVSLMGAPPPPPVQLRIWQRPKVWVAAALAVATAGTASLLMAQRQVQVDNRPRYIVQDFAVQSADGRGKMLASALTTRLSNGIAGIPNVRVVVPAKTPMTAADVDFRVEGAVIPGPDSMQVQAWIVDVKTGQAFGRSSYKGDPGEDAGNQTLILGRIGDDMAVAINRQIYFPPDTTPDHKQARQLAQEARYRIDRKSTDLHATLGLFRQAMRLSPDDFEIASWFANALVAEAGNSRTTERDSEALYREATELIDAILKKAPHHRLALYARCQMLRLMAKPHAAYSACADNNKVLPWSARIHKELGFIQMALGDLDSAQGFFASADQLERRYSVRWIWKYGAGLAYMLAGKNAEARQILREAISLHEDSANSHIILAVVCSRMGETDCTNAALSQFRAQSRQLDIPRLLEAILPAANPYSADVAAKVQAFKAEALKLIGQSS